MSAEELVVATLERIEQLDPALNCMVVVRAEGALADAARADRIASDARGSLHGVPFTVKDVTETIDLPTTYGSLAFEGHQTTFDARVVERLRDAGAILVGKTNTPELACEPVTRSRLHGETSNPWALERTPGGSSGGAAAGLAAGLFPLAQGTDAGGSIRIPASCCGVVGIKPTRGRVSLAPAAPATWGGMLHSGPLARTVRDAAAMLSAMAEPDAQGGVEQDLIAACDAPLRGLRVAYSSAVPGGAVEAEVAASFADALDAVRSLGIDPIEATLDHSTLAAPFATILEVAFAGIGAELSDEQLSLIGPKCLGLMKRGWSISGAEYYNALQAAHRASLRALGAWSDWDILLTPTVPRLPPLRAGFPSTEEHEAKWAEFGLWETFTFVANVTGQPAISVPCRLAGPGGLPIGLQLVGRHWAEPQLLALAAAFEATSGAAERHPPLPPSSLRA